MRPVHAMMLRWLAPLALTIPAAAQAAPLTLHELDQMPVAIACRDMCAAEAAVDRAACLSGCQYPVQAAWEKNNVAPVNALDFMLAVLEFWDGGDRTAICYESSAVVPKAACGQGDCLATHAATECADADGDGLLAWEESLIGTRDGVAQKLCTANAACGFSSQCEFNFEIGKSVCLPRSCGGTGGQACTPTAFHLEPIASNDKEVILHLHFDYSPVPATVLDLRVLYSDVDLVLVDARPLALLSDAGKGVNVTHPAAGVVRLVVLGMGTMAPVPNGAIVELVFQRATESQTTIGFDGTDIYQRNSMAPSQGASQAELAKNELWGSTVAIPGATDGPRLVLAYSFDSLAKPLEYSDVPNAEQLCAMMGIKLCPSASDTNASNGLLRTTTLAALGALQNGSMAAKTLIPGVNGSATYFDGTWDHLDLPLALNEPLAVSSQSSSLSMWLLPEGRSSDEIQSGYYQVLWSHQHFPEETARYGIRVAENAQNAETVDLVWFDDGSTTQPTTPFAVGLPLHKWVHLGMTLDALSGKVQLFVDGALAKTVALAKTPALSCPLLGLEQEVTPKIVLHKQADGSGEAIYLARPENGLFGIDRMDPSGFGLASVIRSSDASFQDPDYSPLIDKILYSSNKSGNTEIWMADGNGSNAVQLTTGFGNASDGVFARRPRWAPNASAIIFESNAFDAKNTTKSSAVYHLYRLKYDTAPEAAAPNLDFGMIVRRQEVDSYRITTGSDHHTNVAWLRGPTQTSLGEIAYSVADPLYRRFQARSLVLPAEITATRNTEGELPVPAAAGVVDSSVRLLAANGRSSEGKDVSRLLYLASQTSFLPSTQFSLSTLSASSAVGGETRIQVLHTPPSGSTGTTLPTEIPSLYLAYDETVGSPDVTMTSTGSRAGSGLSADKTFELRDIGYTTAEKKSLRFVRISVGASTSATIPANAEVAVIRFVRRQADQPLGLALQDRVDTRRLYLKDRARDGAALPLIVRADLIEEVEEAAFSPNGARLILTGVSRSRPTLLRGDIVEPAMDGAAYSLMGEQVLETTSTRTEGLSWTAVDRFMPCNRVAATRNPYLQLYQHGFRGALDELKVYSYVRDAGAFRSDAERGHDWLRAAGRNGVQEPIRPTCTGLDTECPPYMVCNASTNRCERKTCDPTEPNDCAGHGLCSYKPLPVEDENAGSRWLCSSDCNTDSQCFQRDCLNGPCRFCTNGSCNECDIVEKDYGSFKVRETVGCPDSNSWACENGNCISQCYSFENGVSKYLCNPSEEYCLRGHCEPIQWNWSELGPSSLLGLGEMRLNTKPLSYTTAIPQMVPITVKAYGVEDYGHSPEILVEGRVSGSEQAFLAQWFTIGRILVDHRRHVEAQADDGAYSLLTPYPITDLRLRLVTPPLQNFGNASTGFGFSGEDKNLASGSKFALGYELGIPTWKVYAACDARGTTACAGKLTNDPFRAYLRGGEPAAVVLEVKVNGESVLLKSTTKNRVCSYEGTAVPSPLSLPPKKVFYGSIATEKSNEKALYCKSAGAPCTPPDLTPSVDFDLQGKGAALLNCNYFDPQQPETSAGLVMTFTAPVFGSVGGIVTENANGCFLEQKAANGQVIRVPCYEFADGDASLDVMNPGQMVFGSQELLEFDIFRFFAWDSRGP
jgi:hypothetical protein